MTTIDRPSPRITLHHADCIEAMRGMPDGCVDSVVTDPPYGLEFMGRDWDGADGFRRSLNLADAGRDSVFGRSSRTSPEYRAGHLFQEWTEVWAREALRVLKPGGHLLAFGGSRTYHRLAVAVEDAGFEIRDQIMWVYGSGFPKSLDVSKAMDKAGGLSPKAQSSLLKGKREAADLSRAQVAAHCGCTESSVRDWEEGRARATGAPLEFITPSTEYRAKLASLLGYTADERAAIGVSVDRRGDGSTYGLGHSGVLTIGGTTDSSRQWSGWGTALKPAHEPIVVARKPLIGTVVENVMAHGTGALNINGCRVAHASADDLAVSLSKNPGTAETVTSDVYGASRPQQSVNSAGRWPANFIHDGSDEVVGLFPAVKGATSNGKRAGTGYGEGFGEQAQTPSFGDTGSAARFFYCAKTSKSERGEGNTHPTVKPLALMRYLCRLVTPPGGVVLDPFMGSGTTGCAAKTEGFGFIGIEREEAYHAIARGRIDGAQRIETECRQGSLFEEVRPHDSK